MADKSIGHFFRELKRRKVIRVAVAYVIVAWIVVEVASTIFPGMLLPDWTVRLVIGLAIIGFPIALVLAWAVDLTPEGIKLDNRREEASEESDNEKPGQESCKSVAVLPFLNLSNDPDNEFFSDGMSEELLNLLCKLPQLTVASRTSSFSFKGKDSDIATVAKQLGVDVVLEGSVRRSGDNVRISAQLIDAHRDRNLWSETYDRELRDVFAVQDEIARNIVSALQLNLSPSQQQAIRKEAVTLDMQAYDFYLRGRQFQERSEIDQGLKMFEEAIKIDPNFAQAWAGAADCHSLNVQWIRKTPESLSCADECSRKALELAPDLAESHASRCLALTLNDQFDEAEEEALKAIELDPQLYEAHYYLGRLFFAQGKHKQAARAFDRAGEVRPDDVAAATLKSTTVKNFGDEAEIRAAAIHAIEVSERYLVLNPDDALALSRSANDLLHLGEREKALEWAERAYRLNPKVCRYNVACVFVCDGQIERALDILEEQEREGGVPATWVEHDSDWDNTRDHPRFQALLRRLKEEAGNED
jgi:adenylate cyclase